MPKFQKSPEELDTRFEKWLYAIRNLDRLDKVPDKLREQVFEKFFEMAEIANFSQEEVIRYEDSLKYYRDLKNSLDTARDEGHDEGLEEGIGIGREEGIDIGRDQERRETARKMLAHGMDTSTIVRITGLSLEIIDGLK